MFKNAKIASKEEALARLVAGEVFHCAGLQIRFAISQLQTYSSPFRVDSGEANSSSLGKLINAYTDWEIEELWYTHFTKPVLCWVSEIDAEEQLCAVHIVCKTEHFFVESRLIGSCVRERVYHTYATPVKPEELI